MIEIIATSLLYEDLLDHLLYRKLQVELRGKQNLLRIFYVPVTRRYISLFLSFFFFFLNNDLILLT